MLHNTTWFYLSIPLLDLQEQNHLFVTLLIQRRRLVQTLYILN